MDDLFLQVDRIHTEDEAITWSINAAVQRNTVYRTENDRSKFRAEWARLIRQEAQAYRQPAEPVSDIEHCAAIRRIADALSQKFGPCLVDERLRYGTSQKAFNLYLKYLWRIRKVAIPPHCPIDSVVLTKAGIEGSWTKSDNEREYMNWIDQIRKKAVPLCAAEWEHKIWLEWRQNRRG